VQSKERLTGSMRDAQTESECSIFEMALAAGLQPGSDEQIVASLRAMFPDTPQAQLRSANRLPSQSFLEGSVTGRSVTFIKKYQGDSFSGFRVGDRYVGAVISDHAVHYQGLLNDDATRIEGKWWIPPNPEQGGIGCNGFFILNRDV
jgi:hypothetical protein